MTSENGELIIASTRLLNPNATLWRHSSVLIGVIGGSGLYHLDNLTTM